MPADLGKTALPRLGPDFTRFFLGQVTSQLGSAFTHFALPLVVYQATGSAASLAITVTAAILPYTLFSLPAGAIMDRIDRRRAMIGADLVRAALLVSVPVVASAGHLHTAWLYAIAAATGIASAIFDVGAFAAVPALAGDRATIQRANAWLHGSQAAALVVGPMLAAGALTLTSAVHLLYVDGATFLVSAWSLHTVRRSFDVAAARGDGATRLSRRILRDVGDGMRYVWRHRRLRALSQMLILANFFDASAAAQLVALGKSSLGASDAETGVLYAAGGLGAMLLAFLAGPVRRRWSFGAVALAALAAEGAMLVVLGTTSSLALAALSWGAACGSGTLFNINTSSFRQMCVPNDLLARARGAAILLGSSSTTLGTLCGGAYIAATHDVGSAYVIGGCATVAVAIGFIHSPLVRAAPEDEHETASR